MQPSIYVFVLVGSCMSYSILTWQSITSFVIDFHSLSFILLAKYLITSGDEYILYRVILSRRLFQYHTISTKHRSCESDVSICTASACCLYTLKDIRLVSTSRIFCYLCVMCTWFSCVSSYVNVPVSCIVSSSEKKSFSVICNT